MMVVSMSSAERMLILSLTDISISKIYTNINIV